MSAMMPGAIAIGALAKTPAKSLKTRNVDQVGASAQANVKRVNMENVLIVSLLRPNCSLRGAHSNGPRFVSSADRLVISGFSHPLRILRVKLATIMSNRR